MASATSRIDCTEAAVDLIDRLVAQGWLISATLYNAVICTQVRVENDVTIARCASGRARRAGSEKAELARAELLDAGAIDAQFKDGMLTVKLPKTEVKAVKGIEISIH